MQWFSLFYGGDTKSSSKFLLENRYWLQYSCVCGFLSFVKQTNIFNSGYKDNIKNVQSLQICTQAFSWYKYVLGVFCCAIVCYFGKRFRCQIYRQYQIGIFILTPTLDFSLQMCVVGFLVPFASIYIAVLFDCQFLYYLLLKLFFFEVVSLTTYCVLVAIAVYSYSYLYFHLQLLISHNDSKTMVIMRGQNFFALYHEICKMICLPSRSYILT
eukprot:TRINITY_DN5112_c1_g1_i1.p3 TRINITY_DN5112_c1_g1~~TRINITY_DN5112_c1_g1_i1.p3  ORF type:complete len:213 (-),score=-8.37 TRINITY_DN5112_c1_g1_i1:2313-2951(-)